jgi:sugar phosphate isomerase/epimerase
VKKRFADSPITLVGLGTNECFDSPDPERIRRSIEAAKAFVRLSCDCGGSGVKVKPNDFHPNTPHDKTILQIGKSLNVLGRFAADFGQQIRLEVHGSCCELPVIKQIMDVADHPNVAVCWNCNSLVSAGPDCVGEGDLVAVQADLPGHRLAGEPIDFFPLDGLAQRTVPCGGTLLLPMAGSNQNAEDDYQ